MQCFGAFSIAFIVAAELWEPVRQAVAALSLGHSCSLVLVLQTLHG